MTSITDKKLREKLIREKALDLKTTVELVTQNSYDRPPTQTIYYITHLGKRQRNKTRTYPKNPSKTMSRTAKPTEEKQLWILRTTKLDPPT